MWISVTPSNSSTSLLTFFGIDKSKINNGFSGSKSLCQQWGFAPVATTTTSAFVVPDAVQKSLRLSLIFRLISRPYLCSVNKRNMLHFCLPNSHRYFFLFFLFRIVVCFVTNVFNILYDILNRSKETEVAPAYLCFCFIFLLA
jgi:hypothetical protein